MGINLGICIREGLYKETLILEVKNLRTCFDSDGTQLMAVDGVSFSIPHGYSVGIVGESGSGKSVTAYSVLGLLPSTGRVVSGDILWNGDSLISMSEAQRRLIRGSEIGLIFQNPLASLNPVFTIGNQLIETIQLHEECSKEDAKKKAIVLLEKVNIPDASDRLSHYPHQFSLGMCQRIMIALTLAMKPKLLIADEPTASLDVTIQAQLLRLLNDLKKEESMSMLIISHDLGVVAQNCDEILVYYLGKIVEKGTPEQIFLAPKHPYTQALVASIPSPDPRIKKEIPLLVGDIPSPVNLPSGCRFHTRCPKAVDQCRHSEPLLEEREKNQFSACFF